MESVRLLTEADLTSLEDRAGAEETVYNCEKYSEHENHETFPAG